MYERDEKRNAKMFKRKRNEFGTCKGEGEERMYTCARMYIYDIFIDRYIRTTKLCRTNKTT